MSEKKILIVDYDRQSIETLTKALKSRKLQILTAADGQKGYEIFAEEKPDLVILEAILPKIHGFDLTKRIAQESKGRVPVIIVTGLYRGPQYRQEAMVSFGAHEYFEKPVDTDRFSELVRRLLRDEDDIEDDLPDSGAVIDRLSKFMAKIRKKSPPEVHAEPSENKGTPG
jgi:DNA-binding response OmpR family regulator